MCGSRTVRTPPRSPRASRGSVRWSPHTADAWCDSTDAPGPTWPGRVRSINPGMRLVAVRRVHQVGEEVRGVRRAEAGHRIPTSRRRVTGDARVGGVVTGGDVEEVVRVPRGVRADLVERWVDETETATVDLIGDRHQAGPLGARQGRATDV